MFHYDDRKIPLPPVDPVLSQFNQVHSLTFYLLKMHINTGCGSETGDKKTTIIDTNTGLTKL